MKKLSKSNKIAIICAICLMIFVIAILIASEFNIYRAETINTNEKSDFFITLMPFSNYKSNINGKEIRGKYKQNINPNGDFSITFYDNNGEIAFTALSYGDTLQIENMRFKRKL